MDFKMYFLLYEGRSFDFFAKNIKRSFFTKETHSYGKAYYKA